MFRSALFVLALARGALAQQAGTLSPTESHPKLAIQQCSSAGCETLARSIVLDANWSQDLARREQSLPRRQARRLRVDEFSGIFQELAERLGVAAHAPAKIAVFAADGSARAAFEPREA